MDFSLYCDAYGLPLKALLIYKPNTYVFCCQQMFY